MAEKKFFQYLYLIIVICVAFYFIPRKLSVWINNRGVQAFHEKRIEEAIGLYEKSIKIHPNAQTYYNLGCAWESIGEKDKAVVEFQRCIQKDPKYTEAYEAVISIYRQERDYEQAEFYAKTLQALDKGNKLLQGFKDKQVLDLYNQGVIFYKTGQLEKAKARLQEVLNIEPSFSYIRDDFPYWIKVHENNGRIERTFNLWLDGKSNRFLVPKPHWPLLSQSCAG